MTRALASFKRLPHVQRSLARDVHRRLPAPRRHPTPTARSVALKVAAGTDHPRLGRDRLYQACAPQDCPHDPTGCVAFLDTARSTGTRAVSRNPIAVQGEAKMNKNELVSHVAAETSATRASAERMVGTCSPPSATRSRGTSPSPSPASGSSSSATVPRARVAIRKPGSPSPSRPRRCRRSSRRRPFETQSIPGGGDGATVGLSHPTRFHHSSSAGPS